MAVDNLVHPSRLIDSTDRTQILKTLEALKFLLRTRTIVLLTVGVTIPFSIVNLAIALSLYNIPGGCSRDETVTRILIVESIVAASIPLYVQYHSRNLPDNFGLLLEGRLTIFSLLMVLVSVSVIQWAPPLPYESAYDHQVLAVLFATQSAFVVSILQILVGQVYSYGFDWPFIVLERNLFSTAHTGIISFVVSVRVPCLRQSVMAKQQNNLTDQIN
jgi:hypothetical protein